ncbi:Sulfite exporter TauE/SafE [Oryzisolibacter propanilivorax]|uniref:Probable membrane transporter protein n=1 Tax=Oryzisolibacter propanilivorax TaxID=1527607 RepID=A0A1G9QCX8_9BURK|nr:sulfite exporter TauE/SafE family protein [Oryzisolibacter propanilivorax]SDM08878.1 Sulfite exporter TauE/SafE [Oryzisolibacter propanilivorax]
MSIFGLTWLSWLGVALCMALASYVQVITGFAFSLLFIGLISTFDLVPLDEVTNAICVITLIQALAYFRAHPLGHEWRVVRPAIWPSIAGVVAGAALLLWLSGQALYVLKYVLGGVIWLTALAMLGNPVPWRQVSSRGAFRVTGLLAGVMGGLFSAAGPPLVYLLYRQPIALRVIHQSLFLLFAIGQLARLGVIGASGNFTWRSLLYIFLSMPIVFLVQELQRRYPLNLSPYLTTRLAASLLILAGTGLVFSNWLSRT